MGELGAERAARAGQVPVRLVAECPACGSRHSTAVGGAAPAFQERAGGVDFLQPAYTVQRCRACGLHFKSHTAPLEVVDRYHERHACEVYDEGAGFPTERRLRQWLDRLPDGSRVLDFGCSTGRLLKDVASRLHCVGVETNERAAAIARSRGIEVCPAPAVSSLAGRGFDAAVLADVCEHLPHPLEVLTDVARLLKPGGWLGLVAGNAEAVPHQCRLGEHWYFRLIAHLHMASQTHLVWLAGRLGLGVAEMHRCSHYDVPAGERLRQHVQAFAYHRFRDAPRGIAARTMRRVPGLRRAETWSTAPALTCAADHLVARLQRR